MNISTSSATETVVDKRFLKRQWLNIDVLMLLVSYPVKNKIIQESHTLYKKVPIILWCNLLAEHIHWSIHFISAIY